MYPEYLNIFNTAIAGYRHGFHTRLTPTRRPSTTRWPTACSCWPRRPFSDTDAIAVTDAYAADNHLRSIGDLAACRRR